MFSHILVLHLAALYGCMVASEPLAFLAVSGTSSISVRAAQLKEQLNTYRTKLVLEQGDFVQSDAFKVNLVAHRCV